ncbi:MAG TPA: hypothetical protein VF086_19640 [Propionibacteriaceae bacterium]
MIKHLPAVLIIVGTLAIWAFYAILAVAGLWRQSGVELIRATMII